MNFSAYFSQGTMAEDHTPHSSFSKFLAVGKSLPSTLNYNNNNIPRSGAVLPTTSTSGPGFQPLVPPKNGLKHFSSLEPDF